MGCRLARPPQPVAKRNGLRFATGRAKGSCQAIEALGRSTGLSLLELDDALVQQRGAGLLVLTLAPGVLAADLPEGHPGVAVLVLPGPERDHQLLAARVELVLADMPGSHE